MFSFDFLLWVWRGHVMLLAMLAKNKLHMMVSGRCSFVAECIGLSSTDEQNTYYIVEYDGRIGRLGGIRRRRVTKVCHVQSGLADWLLGRAWRASSRRMILCQVYESQACTLIPVTRPSCTAVARVSGHKARVPVNILTKSDPEFVSGLPD